MNRFGLALFASVATTAVISTTLSLMVFTKLLLPEYVTAYAAALEKDHSRSGGIVMTHNDAPGEDADITQDFSLVSDRVTPSVVNIQAYNGVMDGAGGSGVVVSTDGYVVTNYHVVEGADDIEVTFHNKRVLKAQLVGVDPSTDLALLRVRATNLRPIVFSNSDEVQVGQWVLAIGNPFNLASTVTAGIVSAKARNINILRGSYSIESFIQTDAAVNPGNSGGALVNAEGGLVGINTAIMSEGGTFEGYSFAIPSNLVKKVIADLREFGQVKRALLGVNISDVTDVVASDLRLPEIAGVVIRGVNPGSSAAEAGLREGDVITRINGIQTNSVPELQEQVARFRPGDVISLEYIRNGQTFVSENVQLKSLTD